MSQDPDIPRSVRWHGDALRIIDQTLLPAEYREVDLTELDQVVEAIGSLRVRGAPAIGVAAAIGLVASLKAYRGLAAAQFRERVAEHADALRGARPTAANLNWAVSRVAPLGDHYTVSEEIWAAMKAEATAILEEDRRMCRRIGKHGLELIPEGATILTHCNTGVLATAGIGTAMAPIYLAAEQGRRIRVVATETRPLLQGSRLTAWELNRAAIDVHLVTDGAAPAAMRELAVDLVIVGADRIVSNGDVANKIGTYGLAVAARHHGIPMYVAAPSSTFDFSLASGAEVPIEERGADEIRQGFGQRTAPDDVPVYSAAFDVTPADLVDAIITERGVLRPPYTESLRVLRSAETTAVP